MSIVLLVDTSFPGRRPRPRRDEVRRAILDAAAHVFARHGIEAASLDDVAGAAGFTKGAVYSNFRGKQGLVDALIEDRTSAYLELGLESVSSPGTSLAHQARLLGDRLTVASEEQRDWHLLYLELWQRAVRSPSSDGDVFHDQRVELRAAIAAAIDEHAAATGTDLPLPAPELAMVLMALANGLAMEHIIAPDEVPPDLLGRTLALLVGGDDS